MKKKKKVFIGLSGGVDSAVSAALLKKEGYETVGVFIRTWHPDFLPCNEEDERRDAMRVAAHLDIPFLTFDFEEEYKKEVADYMIREYKAGRTPNPDVMCNKEIKFGVFLKKAMAMGADYVATGHYARISTLRANIKNVLPKSVVESTPLGKQVETTQGHEQEHFSYSLMKGTDPTKDQSYFLWTLTQKQLSKILFPIGDLKKTEVRALAKKFALAVAEKKDSQGICFLGDVDLKFFLTHYIKAKKGKVMNERGNIIGWHNGAHFYTLGERHGFIITEKTSNDGRYYIVGKNIKKNTLIVSKERNPSETDFFLKETNWNFLLINKEYKAQIRYHGKLLPCFIKYFKKSKKIYKVIFNDPVLVASGQSCVIYDGDICVGGGIIV